MTIKLGVPSKGRLMEKTFDWFAQRDVRLMLTGGSREYAGAVKGVIGLSGPYDFVPLDSESTIASFGHLDEPIITQPFEHIRADAPPMLLIHGEKDTLVRPRNSRLQNLSACW